MDRPSPNDPSSSDWLLLGSSLPVLVSVPVGSSQPESKQLAFPAGTAGRLITDGFGLLALLVFVLLINQLVTRKGDRSSSQSLAKECQSLAKLRIGYPVGLTLLQSLRSEQLLEQRLGSLGVRVSWIAYTSASSLLTDLSNGVIDFCGGGGTASLFSQAADHLFVRVAKEKYPDLHGEAIVVPEQSTIYSIEQLKDKRVGFDEGSSAHYILILALKSVGLSYHDIQPVFLPQDQAARAFVNGELDAWVHWVPYAPTPDRARPPARSIGDLQSILSKLGPIEIPTLYYALPELVRDYPRVLKAILEELNEAGFRSNCQQLATFEQQIDDLPQADLIEASELTTADPLGLLRQRCLERAIVPIDEPCLRGLEAQVAILSASQLLPAKLNPFEAAHTLQMRQNWTY